MNRHFSRMHKTERLPCPVPECPYQTKRKDAMYLHLNKTHHELDEAGKKYYIEYVRQINGNFH